MKNKGLISCILDAGNFTYCSFYDKSYQVSQKSKNDYVTSVDTEVSNRLEFKLSRFYPNDFFLTEEKEILDDRFNFERVWICDPIDGTSEFINGRREFTISLGLSENQKATLAYVFNPITGEFFYNIEKKLFYSILNHPYKIENLRNQSISHENSNLPKLYISKNEFSKGYFSNNFWKSNFQLFPVSSIAYKLALLSVGKCDLVISFNPKNEWDICAGIALINCREDMMALELKTEQEFLFNRLQIKTYGLIAGKKEIVEKYFLNIKTLYNQLQFKS